VQTATNSNVYYITDLVMLSFLVFFAFIVRKSKRGIMPVAVLTPMTAADENEWKRVNKLNATLIFIIFIPLLVANIVLLIVDRSGRYGLTFTLIIGAGIFVYYAILMAYTDIRERRWLAEQKRKGHPVSEFEFAFPGVSKKRLITGFIALVCVIITFMILGRVLNF